ncbi:hypothetical protein RB195_011204 [Necator americanus]|uniref:Fibronectin type-III domain-containing protein n=1 Tax=Necator americanus TaxID=51031 RepID=A0ABR1D2Q4_NECAM
MRVLGEFGANALNFPRSDEGDDTETSAVIESANNLGTRNCIGQSRKYGGIEEVSTEPGVPGLLHYILDALVCSPSRSPPPAQLGGQVVHHVQFPTQINIASAFGYIQLKTDACTCFVEFGQHSFRLADARCYQYDVISKAQMNGEIPVVKLLYNSVVVPAYRPRRDERRGKYLVQLEYKTTGNDTKAGKTDAFFVMTGEDKPGPVMNPKIELIVNQSSVEYATFSVKWSEPIQKNGIISGYKIRWKLAESPFNIFFVEQCDKKYNIKVFSPNKNYTAHISAKTSQGYGKEVMLKFAVGSPPDWRTKSSSNKSSNGNDKDKGKQNKTDVLTVDRIAFEAQLRRKVGHEYAVGHARILISACTLMISVMFAWFLKHIITEGRTSEKLRKARDTCLILLLKMT